MWDVKETSPVKDLQYGHATVGATPVPLTDLSYKFKRGIVLRTPGPADLVPNTDIVFIGKAGVTPGTNIKYDGIPMPPGSALELPVEDPSEVYASSQSEGQDLAWMGV